MRQHGYLPRRSLVKAWLYACFAMVLAGCALMQRDGPAPGQEVVFFPSIVAQTRNNEGILSIQGRVFEPPEQSRKRNAFVSAAATAMGIDPTDVEKSVLFRERMRFFLADSSRNTVVTVRIGDRVVRLPKSDPAGYFAGEVALTPGELERSAVNGEIAFETVPVAGSGLPTYKGFAMVVPQTGVSVVSDVDDTIKATNMLNNSEKVANTLYRPFQPVDGMADLYRSWKSALGPQAHFHIVSAGPWQMHVPFRSFFSKERFPDFTWDMRSVDVTDPMVALAELSPNPYAFKTRTIRALIERFPKRHFILVGDSGEQDPEVYAQMLAEFPQQIQAVAIRNVTRQGKDSSRYKEKFQGDAAAKLYVFFDPSELRALTSELAQWRQ